MPINSKELHQAILELANNNSFSVEIIHQQQPTPIIALKRMASSPNALNIYISAGIHGDEPAGPFVIEKLLKEHLPETSINWYLIPMLNPQGLELGTRENADAIDLNRDYKAAKTKEVAAHLKWLKKHRDIQFDLTITLHEDWESPGFYCYAIAPPKYNPILTQISKAVKAFSPINLSETIEGTKANEGFILHNPQDFKVILNEWQDWPEAFLLINNRPKALHFTFETASGQPLEQRINTHCAAIRAAIKELKDYHQKTFKKD